MVMQRQVCGKYVAQSEAIAPWVSNRPLIKAAPGGPSGSPIALLRGACLATSDVLAFGGAFLLTDLTYNLVNAHRPSGALTPLAGEAAIAFACVMLALTEARYRQRPDFTRETQQILAASVAALCLTGFFAFWTGHDLPRVPLAAIWMLFPIIATCLRVACRRMLDAGGLWRRRVLVVGSGESLARGLDALASDPRHGYEIVQVMSPPMVEHALNARSPASLLAELGADKVVMVSDNEGWSQRKLTQCLLQGRIPFAVMPQLDGRPVMGCDRTSFFSHDMVMLSYQNNLARPFPRFVKLVFDLALAGAALVFIAPLFLAIAVAVKMDGGPVFFAQRRIGANGKTFACLKFRSMVTHADQVLTHLLERDQAAAIEWRETQKLRHDPRITRVGRLLRMTSLDELPQLLNILRLEMSLVGPRPIVANEVPRYAEDIVFYHETRPGLTGLWQVSGRSDTSYERRVQLDCWYVKNWSIWHDLAIIAKTVPAVLKRSGAV